MAKVGFSRDLRWLSNSEFLAFPKILLGGVGKTLISSESSCYAWTLTPNHLLLKTGELPMARVMRRLQVGYAVTYDLRDRRHGQLFQNRYKWTFCQEDLFTTKQL